MSAIGVSMIRSSQKMILRTTTTTTTTPLVLHRTIPSIRAMRKSLDRATTVGFVPTMGALHEGHLSLLQEARAKNDVVVASIFVNPAQFGPAEDLDKYPRQLERDSELLNELGVDHLFAPSADSMYGPNHVTYVDPVGFDDTAEGRARPGHFRGVATIVTKLFHIVQPTTAYFGQKDAAQCVMIRRMVHDLDMDDDIEIVVKDTVREADGLAMSSRNAYLTTAERKAAPVVYRSLCAARAQWEKLPSAEAATAAAAEGTSSSSSSVESCVLQKTIEAVLGSEPLVSEIQYISVDHKATMQPLTHVTRDEGAIVSLACKVGSVRLIDNIVL